MDIKELSELFKQKGLTLGSVESFTGGKFADAIISIPGASKFYKGGLVTYSNEEKHRLLDISWDDINKYGVVSNEIATLMAVNGQKVLDVDYCVSFTGNAGPEPMEDKEVGEIYIGVASKDKCLVEKHLLKGSREDIRKEAISLGITLLQKIIF